MENKTYTINNLFNNTIIQNAYKENFEPQIKIYCPNQKYFNQKPTSENFPLYKGLEKILH